VSLYIQRINSLHGADPFVFGLIDPSDVVACKHTDILSDSLLQLDLIWKCNRRVFIHRVTAKIKLRFPKDT